MSSFIETLHHIDNRILLFINGHHSPFLDGLMFLISGRFTWVPLYALLLVIICLKYKKTSWLPVLFAVIAIILSDQVADVIKNEVMRLRPSHTPGLMNLLHYYANSKGESYMGGMYGFVSNHAANSASLTLFMALLFCNKYIITGMIVWTFLLCYSRIYLGVHFPSDVAGGLIVGTLTGCIAYAGCRWLSNRFIERRQNE